MFEKNHKAQAPAQAQAPPQKTEGELIVKIPRQMMPVFETVAKSRGFANSREFLANFVRKQLALHLKCDKDDFKLSDIN